MSETVTYTVEVDGETEQDSFTAADVTVWDDRVTSERDVAEAYAQHLAVEQFGRGIDVNTVEVAL